MIDKDRLELIEKRVKENPQTLFELTDAELISYQTYLKKKVQEKQTILKNKKTECEKLLKEIKNNNRKI